MKYAFIIQTHLPCNSKAAELGHKIRMRKYTILENANHHSNIPYTFTGFGAKAKGPALTGTQGVKATEAVMVRRELHWPLVIGGLGGSQNLNREFFI